MLKDLLDRARRVAEEHLPADVLDAGRKLGRTVAAYAPEPLAEVINYVTGDEPPPSAEPEAEASAEPEPAPPAAAPSPVAASAAPAPEASAPKAAVATEASARPAEHAGPPPSLREDPKDVLARVHAKAERGLKPEDRLVVVYATPDEDEEVQAILEILQQVETEVRHNDLRREPQTARQLAKLTGVMVPPYVFINGKHWGSRYELEALAASGDLSLVVANRLDEISEEARRIGHVHESFSDEISVDNILRRWKLGHILCVDDLDSWYEVDRHGAERFFYMGGPRAVDDMQGVAEEIVKGVDDEDFEAIWMLEPSVQLP